MKKPVLIIIAVFCILVAIVAALDYFVLHQFFAAPPVAEPPVAEQPAPSAVSIAPTEKAAPAPAPAQPPITQPPKSLEQNIADFKPGNIVLTTIETNIQAVLSFNIDVKVTSQVGVADGKPTVAVTDINFIGSALLPQSLKDQITGYFTQQIEDVLTRVTEVDVGGGKKVELEYKDINIQEEEATVTVVASPT